MNKTWHITTKERVKCALLGPILLPFRIVILFASLLGAWSFGSLSIIGADLNQPLPWWRMILQKPMRLFARGIMVALGYNWIRVSCGIIPVSMGGGSLMIFDL